MRGTTDPQTTMLSTLTPESMIPPDHPIRRIKKVVEAVLADLDVEFDAMYAVTGRQSVPPEQLLKATVLMVARPPEIGPPDMRVPVGPQGQGGTTHEGTEAHAGADRAQAQGG
ncbi:MAG: hypothetical protein ACREN2_02600, partial [Candidatus Dormibacteria bacterium]